ncbi:MAG TPA: DNA polymerase domain-containing protein, partial [Candidatus Bilamarchaeaceae archaeon]|nr:DNA polymerase domain-containing protein [Candidatus Bilamarchaeaceae archaeon]
LIDRRAAIKRELRSAEKDSPGHRALSARSHALKILANSFYGYLGYARSRWYSRKCAESVTAWGRMHILEAEEKAKASGFRVLYMDTDSLFLLLGEKGHEDALRFLEEVNRSLPEKMELELEGFYKRGVFVSKKAEERGAKKKYALLGEDGRIKIRGFELVRRDWSQAAKSTQRRVLEAILREGSKDRAVAIVRDVVGQLRSGNVPLEDLAIYTQMKKGLSDYDILSPELSAAQKAIKKGRAVEKGSIIGYVVTRKGKSISEKAELLEFASDYDPDYYINNQVLPAVLKILKELGADEYELTHGGRQKGIGDFF